MDGLLQLSAVACERLDESNQSTSCSPASTSSSSSIETVVVPKLPREAIVSKICQQGTSQSAKPAVTVLPSDRNAIREKVKGAFRKRAADYEELLGLCSTITEELVYERAPSKLDYYKNGVQCVKKIFDKKAASVVSNADATAGKDEVTTDDTDAPKAVKRAKTQH